MLFHIFSIMPHSAASKPMLPGALITGDCFLPDAPEQVPNSTKEADEIDSDLYAEESTRKVTRDEVTLDNLFDDFGEDEDDELLGSGSSKSNNESSPSEAQL